MPAKKKFHYETYLEHPPSQKILLNINHLEKGDYELNIIHKNKIIKKTTFNKK
ncbi:MULTISPECIES: hypothetical protein [Flavobacterium]|uniref:hypothetical protein n=1 Tax=Flavobacterium TaxID=237 RepID=UPI0013E90A6E|nr:hypothetical protein [Flavobacterium piscinae]